MNRNPAKGAWMEYRGIRVEDTYCECTDVFTTRLVLTAVSEAVALHEAAYLCGWSIITAAPIQGCVEGHASPQETPDGRPGALIQLNAPVPVGLDAFRDAVLERLYLVPHLPTCSVFNAAPATDPIDTIDAGSHVGRWGDGHEKPVCISDRDVVSIPIMTGVQHVERALGIFVGTDGVLEVFASDAASCLVGAQEAAARIVHDLRDVAVFNYPVGGISGAKVGGLRYTEEGVTINEPFCPSVRGAVETRLPDNAGAVIEFPLIAVSEDAVRIGLKTALDAFAATPGVVAITAPSFGGTWGGRHVQLREVLATQ